MPGTMKFSIGSPIIRAVAMMIGVIAGTPRISVSQEPNLRLDRSFNTHGHVDDDWLCGPNSLLVATSRVGVQLSLEALTTNLSITDRGVSMWDLKLAAERYGMTATGRRLVWGNLSSIRSPAVLFIEPAHFLLAMESGVANPSSVER